MENSEIKSLLKQDLFKEEPENKNNNGNQAEPKNTQAVYSNIFEAMKALKKEKEDVSKALMQLAQTGKYEEYVEIFEGLGVKFVTPKPIDTSAIFTLLEDEVDTSMNNFQFKLGLYNLASILEEYQDINLTKKCYEKISKQTYEDKEQEERALIKCKAEWIENNIPLPVFQLISSEALNFQQFIYWIGTPEVFDFLRK